MKKLMPLPLATLLFSACASSPVSAPIAVPLRLPSGEGIRWETQGGIETATLRSGLILVRADPRETPLELVMLPDSSGSVAEVAKRRGLAVAINAAMFAKDYKTSIGYMRSFGKVNNDKVSAKLRGFLMFHPKGRNIPAVKIGGKEESDAYHTTFQTYRMIDEQGKVLWKKGTNVHPQVGLAGVDRRHRVLFFFQPGVMDVVDMVEEILALDLDLTGLLYLDGGSHAALHLSPERGQSLNTWISIPNLVGIKAAE